VASAEPTEKQGITAIRTHEEKVKPEFGDDEMVCYCFGHTRKAIEQDFISNGQSLIMAQIASAKKAGGCDCAVKNPKGR
jgi:hypothetical protein